MGGYALVKVKGGDGRRQKKLKEITHLLSAGPSVQH